MIRVEDEKEKSILEKFKAATEDLHPDDITCLRFLRARDHDLGRAEEMFRKSYKWRLDNDISSYGKWIPPKVLADYDVYFTRSGSGVDLEGRPVVFIPLGIFNAKDLLEAGHKELLIQFSYHLLESLLNFIGESSCSQCVVVIAAEGLSMRQLLHMDSMQTLYGAFQNLEQNYPEILKHLLVINAPWIFSIGFSFVKPILSKHTMSKIQIFNSDKTKWINALTKIMPKDAIPDKYFE